MKKIIMPVAAFIITAALSGCGSNKVDVEELASKLVTEGQYAEELSAIDDEVTLKRYGIDESWVEDIASYAGTKAVADEVVVIKAKDHAEEIKEKLSEHRDSQIESYKSYRPDEVPKLESAILYGYNGTVIFCVSEDADNAQQIIFDYTKK